MNTKHHHLLRLCLLILVILHSSLGLLHSQVPQLVSYQGRVAVGTVNFEGTGQFRFALVNAAGNTVYWGNAADTTPADGTPDAAVNLTVTKGLYSVLLGDTSIANMAAIPTSVWTNADVRLRVWFNDGVNGNQLLTPDQRLAPNGYLPDGSVSSAAIANGAVTSAKIVAGSVTSVKLASGLTLGGTTSGTFSGNITGNASTATSATSFTGALSGDVTGTQSATAIAAATVTGKALTGFASTTGTITAGDTILTAINKLNGNVALSAPIASPTFTGTVTVPANGLVVGTNQLVTTGGNVGIGTSSPGRPLQIDGTSPAMVIGSEFSGRTSLLMAVTANSGGHSIMQSISIAGGSYGALSLQPNGGDVGIGTETPTAKLEVNGNIKGTAFIGNGSALIGLNGANLTAGSIGASQLATGAVGSAQLGSNLTLSGTTTGTFSGNLVGNASTATTATTFSGALAGDVTGTQSATTIDAATITGKALTGFASTTGTITASDTILTAINKLSGNVTLKAPLSSPSFTGFVSVPANAFRVGENQLVAKTGNIGIGTDVPDAELHVVSQSAGNGNNTAAFYAPNIGVHQSHIHYGTTGDWIIRSASSAGKIVLQDEGGNVGIGTTTPATKLDVAGEITCVAINLTSDRNAKEQFKPVNAREVLDKVVGMPITEWQYKARDGTSADSVRHIGPMAQDFRAAFALGHDERHITSVDADGVALAAIQGLNDKLEAEVRAKDAALSRLERENQRLAERMAALEARLQFSPPAPAR